MKIPFFTPLPRENIFLEYKYNWFLSTDKIFKFTKDPRIALLQMYIKDNLSVVFPLSLNSGRWFQTYLQYYHDRKSVHWSAGNIWLPKPLTRYDQRISRGSNKRDNQRFDFEMCNYDVGPKISENYLKDFNWPHRDIFGRFYLNIVQSTTYSERLNFSLAT